MSQKCHADLHVYVLFCIIFATLADIRTKVLSTAERVNPNLSGYITGQRLCFGVV